MMMTKRKGGHDIDSPKINSPLFFKQLAIGIALAAPLIALIQWKVHELSTDDSYKCRNVSQEECAAMKKTEAQLRERMRQSSVDEAKVTREEEERRRNSFRPNHWAD
ncbi:hypothetical protein GALL_119130 [mine drainage metagenome]|uniref:Uncharacterized protein n=1 Tax=mine drainage metagenome TaxID=410659 RepID=A0A1J5SX03_9ZZZZ